RLTRLLEAGGGYLPLDPDYPRERLGFMVADAGARLFVTQSSLREHLPATAADLVCLDADWPTIAAESTSASASGLLPHNLAYVIYTSGSTGQPKGVAVTHQSVSNLSSAQMINFPVQPGDRVLGLGSIGFDASIEQKLLPLLRGACVVLMVRNEMQETSAFWDVVSRHRVNYLDTTPSLLAVMIDAFSSTIQPRRIVLGGEEATPVL